MLRICHVLVFLAAGLLFQVQLIAAKAMLPGFGGSSLVWAASVLVFQVLLLGGYAWAAWVGGRLATRTGWAMHGLLLLAPVLLFPLSLDALATPSYTWASWVEIAGMLATTVGPGFVMLATVSVVCQRALANSPLPERVRPYVLYATSNLGSFAGLLTYPILVEPLVDLDLQLMAWQLGYVLVAALQALVLWGLRPRMPVDDSCPELTAKEPLPRALMLRWLCLSAGASAMLIAVTNVITMDLAAIPLLWIIPLSLYLLTFALVFKRRPWLPQALKDRFPLALAVGSFLFLLTSFSYQLPVLAALLMHWLVLLVVCLVCHGEMARTAPVDPRHLGTFYLIMSLGGASGSLLASFVAPVVSSTLAEYPAALCLAALGLSLGGTEAPNWPSRVARMAGILAVVLGWPLVLGLWPGTPTNLMAAGAGLALALLYYKIEYRPRTAAMMLAALLVASQWLPGLAPGRTLLHTHRNFYGITTVFETEDKRLLRHGTTLHGSQFLDPFRASEALTYYHVTTPSGELLDKQMDLFPHAFPLALVGLGAGSLAVYAQPGQTVDVYELDPHNGYVATNWFSFLARSKGKISMTFGDARLTLRGAEDHIYGVIVVDAFNSDSIPVHLLTKEAFEEYEAKLMTGGVLLLHVSNKYLELPPVVAATSQAAGWIPLEKRYTRNVHPDAEACIWMAIVREDAMAEDLVSKLGWTDLRGRPLEGAMVWTDRFSHLLGALK